MKKKGFTLVELLAVIAILAILVIIALPNVLSMYRQARENSFQNEVKEVFRTAQQQFLIDSMIPTSAGATVFYKSDDVKIYQSNGTSEATGVGKKLDLQGGGTNFKYCVKLTSEGKVDQLIVSNGTYIYYNKKELTDAQDIVFRTEADGDDKPINFESASTVVGTTDAKYKCTQ